MTSSRMLLGLLLSLALSTGCDDHTTIAIPEAGTNDSGPGVDAGMTFSDTGIGFSELSILRVVPDHGPFTGGNVAVLRGAGFTADATATFGTHDVQGADHTLIDARRLQVVVPAGSVGVVDVSIRVGTTSFTLPNAYTYDAISVDPDRGAVAGGTFVNVVGSGTHFATGDMVLFGRSPATDVTVVSPERITCRSPAQSAGTVDVTVVSGADGSELTAVQAYDYYDSSDPVSGGLGGGPANGTINVTAIDAASGMPVPGAFVIVGEDLTTTYQGTTDAMGQISFSGPDLVGQHTVHVSKHCYERTSFVAFDAQDVTAFLVAWEDPMCGMGMAGPPGRGRNAAFVEGDLVFPGANEYGPNPWDIVPHPPTGCFGLTQDLCTADTHDACLWSDTGCSTTWVRVAYTYTTQLDVTQYPNYPLGSDNDVNPAPDLGGATPRVLESITPPAGHVGYPYRLLARPAGLAVYALAGLENTTTGVFIPYVMGVARNVLVGPGEDLTGVNIEMNLPLDHSLVADLGALPAQAHGSPDRFYMRAVLDLGGEGVIVRRMPGHTDPSTGQDYDFDTIHRRDASREFRFVAEPPLEGTLDDARFEIIAGYTSAFDELPLTVVMPRGITAVDDTIQLPAFLGVPDAVAPIDGGRLPPDRVLRWQEVGGVPADVHLILMSGADGNPAWRIFVRGDQTSAPIPDLSSIPMVDDIPEGEAQWYVFSIQIPGFDFDQLTYNEMNEGYWSAYSANMFTLER